MKVLVAEDNPLTLGGLTEVLQTEGYHVLQAANGAAALELFEREAPDFVCLDIMMPGVNGYDLCRRMRAARPQTPIVFITAKSEEMDKVLGLELGADDFIVKPFGLKEVVARIRAVTRRCLSSNGRQSSAARPAAVSDGRLDRLSRRAAGAARRGHDRIELARREGAGAAAFLSRAGAGPQHHL